jgi:hypothetical protein
VLKADSGRVQFDWTITFTLLVQPIHSILIRGIDHLNIIECSFLSFKDCFREKRTRFGGRKKGKIKWEKKT